MWSYHSSECITPFPPPSPLSLPPSRSDRSSERLGHSAGQCRLQLLNFQSSPLPSPNVVPQTMSAKPPCRIRQHTLFPVRPFSVFFSLHTLLLLLQTPSAFSPRSLQLLPCTQSQFFKVVPYRTGTQNLVPALPCFACSLLCSQPAALQRTKHTAHAAQALDCPES